MNGEETGIIRQVATDFRSAIDCCYFSLPPISFRDFPQGACGDTCELLARYLLENGSQGWEYVCGWRGESSHAWLEKMGIFVDITADQFRDGRASVIVEYGSEWHSQFDVSSRHLAAVIEAPPEIERQLKKAYRMICDEINGSRTPPA